MQLYPFTYCSMFCRNTSVAWDLLTASIFTTVTARQTVEPWADVQCPKNLLGDHLLATTTLEREELKKYQSISLWLHTYIDICHWSRTLSFSLTLQLFQEFPPIVSHIPLTRLLSQTDCWTMKRVGEKLLIHCNLSFFIVKLYHVWRRESYDKVFSGSHISGARSTASLNQSNPIYFNQALQIYTNEN